MGFEQRCSVFVWGFFGLSSGSPEADPNLTRSRPEPEANKTLFKWFMVWRSDLHISGMKAF